jgi:hypothetical protein
MEKLDLLILAGAGAMAATAGVLWFTREPSIALEDAPPAVQQMVAESADPQVRDAVKAGRQVRLSALKPSSDVPTFQAEVANMGGTDDTSMTEAEMRETVRAMQRASDRADQAAAEAARARRVSEPDR